MAYDWQTQRARFVFNPAFLPSVIGLLLRFAVLTTETSASSYSACCRLLNFDDRSEADSSASQSKADGRQDAVQKDNLDRQGMPGPNMSLAYRDDEVERQNFANEPTLKWVI